MVQRINNLWEDIKSKDSQQSYCLILKIKNNQFPTMEKDQQKLLFNGSKLKKLMKKKGKFWNLQRKAILNNAIKILFV